MSLGLSDFAARRRELMALLGENAIAILPAARETIRNRDVHYPFRQDSDFQYLTGFGEPDAVAVIAPGRPHGEFVLFVRDKDEKKEIWDGYRAGPEGAVKEYGADDAFPIEDIDDILPGMLEASERVFYTLGNSHEFDDKLIGWLKVLRGQSRTGKHAPSEVQSLEHLLHELRLIKSGSELKVMRQAGDLAARAHRRAMAATRPGKFEYEIEAEISHEFNQEGSTHSYTPIVGGGANGCVLHYITNRDELQDGDLVLIDAGCEIECYASDITRTFPVNGKFTGEQREIYELVLASQLAAIEEIRPGNHWNAPHEAVLRVLTQGLVDIGLLDGDVDALIEDGAYQQFYMHRTGHWLGMDVHDVGDYQIENQWRELEPGMVMTVEPGLYIREGSTADPRWWNIGVRIEDDVAVNRNGYEVLSSAAPKTVAEIEALVGTGE